MAEGTEVVARVANSLDAPRRLVGFSSRRNPDRGQGRTLPVIEIPGVTIPSGEERELRPTADVRGTYPYRGWLESSPTAGEPIPREARKARPARISPALASTLEGPLPCRSPGQGRSVVTDQSEELSVGGENASEARRYGVPGYLA